MPDWLMESARVHPEKTALIFQAQTWNYAALDAAVTKLAGQLEAAGLQAGQHVAVLLPNRAETIFCIHALARVGAVLVPLNLRLTPPELLLQIEQADCSWLIAENGADLLSALSAGAAKQAALPNGLILWRFPSTHTGSTNAPPDLHSILFTSGTTGFPKGAMLTSEQFFSGAMASAYRLGVLPEDRWLLCLPLYHVGGLAIVLRAALYGISVVLVERFEPAALLNVISQTRPTLISLVPTMLSRLLAAADGIDLSFVRCVLLGGAAAPAALLEQAEARRLPLAPTYGLTEAASQVATCTPALKLAKPGCAGKPLRMTHVRIVGEDNAPLPPGCIGEIQVQGPTITPGYYRQPEATRGVLVDGWLHTGDLGYLDADGDLWVVQRRTDLIVTGGENVYPAEVERVLLTHPAITDACVVGIPDPEWGQRVAAAVVTSPPVTGEALDQHCRSTLAGYKIPRDWIFVAELPQTASGKISRQLVQKLFER